MATYTPLSIEDADRVVRAHRLGPASRVVGIRAGSVNSNYFVDAEARRVFVRIYEEQDAEGVSFEWALLEHLERAGLPVPIRVSGTEPGVVRVADKPTAVFELVGGHEACQAMVDGARAHAVGAVLARTHAAVVGFSRGGEGRFGRADVRRRLEGVAARDRPELREAVEVLGDALDRVDARWPDELPTGVIHGDLFRDNVRWRDDAQTPEIECVLDWESAEPEAFVYDLAVAILAWCYGDHLEVPLLDAMVAGYEGERPLSSLERRALPLALEAAAARFTVTRITDFHLRQSSEQVFKDWRRYYERLLAVRRL